MRWRGTICFVLLTGLAVTSTAREFSATDFRRDVRRLHKLAEHATRFRLAVDAFGASTAHATRITGEQHIMADDLTVRYAKLHRGLMDVADRWKPWIATRSVRRDELPDGLRGMLTAAAACHLWLESTVTFVAAFEGTIFERRFNQRTSLRGVDVIRLFVDARETLAAGTYQTAVDRVLAFVDLAGDDAMIVLDDDGDAQSLVRVLRTYGSDLARSGRKGVVGRALLRTRHRLSEATHRVSGSVASLVTQWSLGLQALPEKKAPPRDIAAGLLATDLERVRHELSTLLQPGDLLLYKSNRSFFNKFIPGYFTHTALWLGTYEEMIELGLFHRGQNRHSYQQALEHHCRLAEGNSILEALLVGVVVNPLERSLNWYDTCVVLRLKSLESAAPEYRHDVQSAIVHRGVRHLGQGYDLSFDVDTSDSIVCSELAYMAYPDAVRWPVTRRFGRSTISPDEVAFMAGPHEEQPLEVIYFNHEGRSTTGSAAWRVLWQTLFHSRELVLPRGRTEEERRLLGVLSSIDP